MNILDFRFEANLIRTFKQVKIKNLFMRLSKTLTLFFFLLLSQFGCTISDPEMMEVLMEIKAQNEKLLQEVEKMKLQLDALDGKYQVILASLADNKKELETLRAQIDALKAQLTLQLEKINQLSAQLEIQGADIEKLSNEIKTLKESCEKLKGLIEELLAGKSPIPTNGLVVWYPFNGNAEDESGNRNNGINNGAVLSNDRFSNPNKSYFFSSVNCSTRIDADVNTSMITSGITISLWFKMTGSGCVSPRILEFWPGSEAAPGMVQLNWAQPEKVIRIGHVLQNRANYQFQFPAGDDLLNKWVNLVYTHDGLVGKVFFNGELKNSTSISGNPVLATDLAIGRMNHPAFDAFQGDIDDLAVWNRALSTTEISKIYKGEKF